MGPRPPTLTEGKEVRTASNLRRAPQVGSNLWVQRRTLRAGAYSLADGRAKEGAGAAPRVFDSIRVRPQSSRIEDWRGPFTGLCHPLHNPVRTPPPMGPYPSDDELASADAVPEARAPLRLKSGATHGE